MAPGPKGYRMYWPNATMEFLARQLSGLVGRPIVDSTGLKGKYEISLSWTTDGMSLDAPANDLYPPIMQALPDQLGLRLELKKGPADFLVVDHVEKVPVGD